jgi:predicted  nucleic acid-binding Zn-ribbon protein
MKKFINKFGLAILSILCLLIVSSAIVLFGNDSYNAGKSSIAPQLEQTNNEFTLKVQQLQLEVVEKQRENTQLQSQVDVLTEEKISLESQVVTLTQERDNAIASGSSSAEQIAELNNQINVLNDSISQKDTAIADYINQIEQNTVTITALDTRISRLLAIISRTATAIYPEDLDGITSIGSKAFANYNNLTYVELPEGITTIGDGAFSYCKALSTVILPDTVTSISAESFYYCSALKNITLPSGLVEIPVETFRNSGLTSIEIPSSVKYIRDSAFHSCASLTSINFSEDSVLQLMGSSVFSGCTKLTSIDIPSVVEMGSHMFSGCTSLTTVNFPSNLTKISSYLFNNCSKLTTVTFAPGTYLSMWDGSYAFYNCKALTDLTVYNIWSTYSNSLTFSALINLSQASILHLLQELHVNTGTTAITLNIGSGNISKIEGLYVKLIDVTDDMRLRDEYIDNKLPFVVCESTDEGAMTINDYVTSKNFILK